MILGSAEGQEPAASPLTNIGAIKRLSPQEASRPVPVLFRGVVTGGAPSVGDLFVQDGIQCVYLQPSQPAMEVQVGDVVEVEGVSVSSFSPWVAPTRITRLGTAPLPPARPATGQDLLSPAFLESRVQVEGLVRRALRDVRYAEPRYGGPPITLSLLISGERVTATVWKRGMDDQLLGLAGSYIRLTGVCTPVYNPQGQVVRGAIHVTPADTVHVLEAGPTNLFALPRTALGDLLKYEVRPQPHSLTHVAGVVTAVASPYSFFVQDNRRVGVRVRAQQAMEFTAGDEVSLVGLAHADPGPGDPPLDKVIRRLERTLVLFTAEQGVRLGSRPLPDALPVTAETLAAVTHHHKRIVLTATVAAVSQSLLPKDYQMTLSAGGHLLRAMVFPASPQGKPPAVGSRVRVTGVLEPVGEPEAEILNFQLHVASLADIVVLAPPPTNYVTALSWALLVAGLVGAAALAWAFTMRRVVRNRTTALATTNRELAEANAALAKANAAKGQFLANMSHEIRTPMNAVLGLVQVLQREGLPPAQRDIVSRVAQAGRSLMRILDDILDFSRVEAGGLRLEERPFELSALLAQVDGLFAEAARSKGLDWQVDRGLDGAGAFLGDPVRLEQILTNLAANAIKFTRQGHVHVRATVREVARDQSGLRIEVSDTGPGIAPDVLAGLFQPFVQADASISRRHGGTGLGLVISRRLAELMGGRLSAESVPGQGSTFWLELPLRRAPATVRPTGTRAGAPASRLLEGRSFLVVDDNALNLDLVTFALRHEGSTTMAATSGPEALNRLRQEPQRYDAILMDIQMPGMDGLETIRAIRQELGLIHLPILALSAAVLPEQRQAALEAGANEFVPKPMEVAALVAALQRCWRAERPGGPGHDAGPGPARSRFPQVAGLDTEHAAGRLNHDADFFVRSLVQFKEEFASLPRELREPWTARGPDKMAGRLHNLRGIAGVIGARELSEAAALLETAIRTADPEADRLRISFAQQLDALLQDIARLEAAS